MMRRPLRTTLFPYTTLFRSMHANGALLEPGDAMLDREIGNSVIEIERAFITAANKIGLVLEIVVERALGGAQFGGDRSEEHTSELQSHVNLVCRLLLEKKKK